jgi:mRNA-degrading endonuclease toxin of MazEF toxin-antitoxin module
LNAPHFKRGSLYWARLDKRRPVLVISPDYRNERATDVIIVPASTTIREAPTHVVLRTGEGGVRTRTVLKCEQVTTLPRTDLELRPLGGRLSPARLAAVERALLRAIGIAIAEPE